MINPKELEYGAQVRNLKNGLIETFWGGDGEYFTATNSLDRDVTRYCRDYERLQTVDGTRQDGQVEPQPAHAAPVPQARPAFDGFGSDADFRARLDELGRAGQSQCCPMGQRLIN
jgi:hypothetical protein